MKIAITLGHTYFDAFLKKGFTLFKVNYSDITDDFLKKVRDNGIKLYIYNVNDDSFLERNKDIIYLVDIENNFIPYTQRVFKIEDTVSSDNVLIDSSKFSIEDISNLLDIYRDRKIHISRYKKGIDYH